MGKISELDHCVDELRSAAQALTAVADGLAALFKAGSMATGTKVQAAPAESEPVPRPEPITLEEVRAVLAEKSRAGHTAAVREIILRHGANKLSEVSPIEYTAILLEAEALK